MLIECIIRRVRKGVPGSTINFPGGKSYRFEPNAKLTDGDEDAHVCEVGDKAHIQRLLSITEGYKIYGDDGSPAVEAEEEEEVQVETVKTPAADLDDDDDPTLKVDSDDDVNVSMCRTIAEMTVHEAKEQLIALSEEQLTTLAGLEMAGQNRSTLLQAIEEEQEVRREAAA
jgi:hypothetical protein